MDFLFSTKASKNRSKCALWTNKIKERKSQSERHSGTWMADDDTGDAVALVETEIYYWPMMIGYWTAV